jgi:hypothetical protein
MDSFEQDQKLIAFHNELKSWDWIYGQTPKFNHIMQKELTFGRMVSSFIIFSVSIFS